MATSNGELEQDPRSPASPSSVGLTPAERVALNRLVTTFAGLPPPPDPLGLYPDYARLREDLLESVAAREPESIEERFLHLYSHLHGYEVPLTADERQRFRAKHGYLNHVGGLSPILKAGPFINRSTVSADFGAGNGLQGLLMQLLTPHARTVQIELSSGLVAAGRALQGWLGIAEDRVEWLVGDVTELSPARVDFAYLYRPVRPTGAGRAFYEQFARRAEPGPGPGIIFSIADCLADLLAPTFEVFYGDGHLTCFRRAG